MDITVWLERLGLGRYAQAFRDNDVDAEVLPRLTTDDLTGLGVTSIGHRRKLLDAIAALRAGDTSAPPASAHLAPTAVPRSREAERRQLTVMFADLVGSTALSARLDPEEMGQLLRSYQDAVAGAVARYGGHVAKLIDQCRQRVRAPLPRGEVGRRAVAGARVDPEQDRDYRRRLADILHSLPQQYLELVELRRFRVGQIEARGEGELLRTGQSAVPV